MRFGARRNGVVALNQKLFNQYRDLLLRWNETYNLTAITDAQEIQIKHFEDSLAPLPFLPEQGRLLDIGSGAGFPGIPIKIEKPELDVVLLDSSRKRTQFCEAVIRELKIKKITVVHGRTEAAETQKKLGEFDVVISRATFPLEKFLLSALPYCSQNGVIIAMRGREWQKELEALSVSRGFVLSQTHPYVLQKNLGERCLIIFRKEN